MIKIFCLKLSKIGFDEYSSGLKPTFLSKGLYVGIISVLGHQVPFEINPYKTLEEQKKEIKNLSKNKHLLEKYSIQEISKYTDCLKQIEPSYRSSISQVLALTYAVEHNISLVDVYSIIFNKKKSEDSVCLYASGGTLLEEGDYKSLDREINFAKELGIKSFKYRPSIGSQLSHQERLKNPPPVNPNELNIVLEKLQEAKLTPYIDLGCRLENEWNKQPILDILKKHSLVEEPCARKSRVDFSKYGLSRVSGGEHCDSRESFSNYLNSKKGISVIQPDLNLISAYDILLMNWRVNYEIIMHNWVSVFSARHNLAISNVINAKECEWPVIDNYLFNKYENDGINIKDGKAFSNAKGIDYCFTARKLMSFFGDNITVQEI